MATLDLEPELISMQNKYTRGWYNCILCDITVSGGWHNCFRRDLAFFRVDSNIYCICDITGKLIQKCYIEFCCLVRMAAYLLSSDINQVVLRTFSNRILTDVWDRCWCISLDMQNVNYTKKCKDLSCSILVWMVFFIFLWLSLNPYQCTSHLC